MAKEIKMRALLVTTTPEKQYIIQLRHKFLFFKWWETYNYGNGIFTKAKIKKIFEMVEKLCKQKGYEFSTEIIDHL